MGRHLSLIPDGNRRWARARGQGPRQGHEAGLATLGRILPAAFEAGVEVCSFWWGSPANLLRRERPEVAAITGGLDRWLQQVAPRVLADHDACFEVHGRWQELCPEITPGVEAARAAAGGGPRTLVLLMAYDGRDELVHAARRAGSEVDRAGLQALMWTGGLPPVDLVVRTGGEAHLSADYLLWQIAETQLCFTDVLWPDYTSADLQRALDDAAKVGRRFGA